MWKEYVKEGKRKKPNPYANTSSKKSNRNVIKTDHAIDRMKDARHNKDDISQDMLKKLDNKSEFKKELEKVIKKAMPIIVSKFKDKSGNYGIHSKSTNINVIIDWRPDREVSNDSRNHAVVVSVLPLKKNVHFRPSDTQVIVEGKEIVLEAIIEI
jgi:hypothetical protein